MFFTCRRVPKKGRIPTVAVYTFNDERFPIVLEPDATVEDLLEAIRGIPRIPVGQVSLIKGTATGPVKDINWGRKGEARFTVHVDVHEECRRALALEHELEALLKDQPGFIHVAFGFPFLIKGKGDYPNPGVGVSVLTRHAGVLERLITGRYPDLYTNNIPIYIDRYDTW